MPEIVATTERLILREWGTDDGDRFYAIMNTPDVMRWLGGVQDVAEWNAAVDRLHGYQRNFGFTFWLVERRSDGEILGFCGLKRANTPGGEAFAGEVEIGWRFRQEVWGQGYAKEAAIASFDLAFGRFGAPQVVAVTATGNLPSQGLMIRLGMTHRPELDFVDGRFPVESEINPQVVYSISSADWGVVRR